MKKTRFLSQLMAIIFFIMIMPVTKANAQINQTIYEGEIVDATRTEEEFIFNSEEDDEYIIYSNGTGQNTQVKLSIYDKDYKLVKSDNQNFKVNLSKGKYFVKIESIWGIPLNWNVGVIGTIKMNQMKKISNQDNTYKRVYKLSGEDLGSRYPQISTCSYENDEEDTVLTIYDNKGNKMCSNDDNESLNGCKFSNARLDGKVQAYLQSGQEFFVSVETKDTSKPLSTALVYNDASTRHELYVEFITPKEKGYFLRDEDIEFKVYASDSVKTLDLNYKGLSNGNSNDSETTIKLGELTKDSKTNTYKGTLKATMKDSIHAYYVDGKYESPKFVATPSGYWNQSGETEIDGYITSLNRERYMKMDKSWYYNSPYDHSFVDYGTNKYNCFAYGYDINDQSIYEMRIPESSYNLKDFTQHIMEWQYRVGPAFTNVSDKELPNANLINYGYGSHYGKVVKWDANGKPLKVISKWGQAELIESNAYDLVGYGSPTFWVSGKYTPNREPLQ